MPTAIYKTANNERVPSVTTVNAIGKDSGGLVHWAWELGTRGLDYRKVRDEAAAAGDVGHLLVEAAIKNRQLTDEDFPTDGARKLGRNAFDAYVRFCQVARIRWTDSEVSLVSEKHRFGGTIDLVGVEEGANVFTLGDIKTGSLYPEHLVQLAAYGRLFEECTGNHVANYHLMRFNRDTGDFVHAQFADLSDAWEAFLLKRQLYDRLKLLKKRI
jgi:hypothetical protein